ncbi:rab geranylgeranyltransferase alpha subunit [Schizosaccharomyces japonicus yFS275]|uniref:Geranylgeranyl transferase type-2 subunit alpha n=1 Tax=Schizosaccharomyces japonicus (strain yFS275 / FY16936) TaxID=402676 RepID=B6K544_SCHJY|nr:rab geranylgeranyltransferase alpha subunit [Schizosaccharomyces japonicus yFS275]EEB08648.2 rab geranylgeranyltransferase alpha subunit [Schizosaccharomyces japonicus yFS275]
MHGVLRRNVKDVDPEVRMKKEREKIKKYRALLENVLDRKKKKDYSKQAFDLTTELLDWNPETYSAWNYRREILLNGIFPNLTDAQKQDVLNNELKYVTMKLKDHPKVYWLFNHRRWSLENAPYPDWQSELMLTEHLLIKDQRNFHAWHYRRYVVAAVEKTNGTSLARRELEYTRVAIEADFSNFSAWHSRTKLLQTILNEESDEEQREKLRSTFLSQELDTIHQAIFTDPEDSSSWIYHRWLMGFCHAPNENALLLPPTKEQCADLLRQEINLIHELYEMEPENRWCCELLIEYGRSLQRINPQLVDGKEQEEWVQLARKLQTIDPLRKGRYLQVQKEIEQVSTV